MTGGPVSYVIGQPVVVTVHPDGHVVFAVDLSDVDRPRDIGDQVDWSDDEVDRVAAVVAAAIAGGHFDIGRA